MYKESDLLEIIRRAYCIGFTDAQQCIHRNVKTRIEEIKAEVDKQLKDVGCLSEADSTLNYGTTPNYDRDLKICEQLLVSGLSVNKVCTEFNLSNTRVIQILRRKISGSRGSSEGGIYHLRKHRNQEYRNKIFDDVKAHIEKEKRIQERTQRLNKSN